MRADDRQSSGGSLCPLIIRHEGSDQVEAALMNPAAFEKSTERRRLWLVHPETGRILPRGTGEELVELADRGSWYEAVLGPSAGTQDRAADTGAEASSPETDDAVGRTGVQPAQGSEGHGVPNARALSWGETLEKLVCVIRGRKDSMPEGSYTAYLFSSGAGKIRKKTGEEAVELILARSEKEIVAEAADLMYHVLVLFEALDVPVDALFEELQRRSDQG